MHRHGQSGTVLRVSTSLGRVIAKLTRSPSAAVVGERRSRAAAEVTGPVPAVLAMAGFVRVAAREDRHPGLATAGRLAVDETQRPVSGLLADLWHRSMSNSSTKARSMVANLRNMAPR